MEYKEFKKIWDKSGLPEYYERIDALKRIGFTFDKKGDMDHYESEALNEWLGDDREIKEVSLLDCKGALPQIRARAEVLRGLDCYDLFVTALKSGTLQQCIHDEWVNVDPESITVGYLIRARHFRISQTNAENEESDWKHIRSRN